MENNIDVLEIEIKSTTKGEENFCHCLNGDPESYRENSDGKEECIHCGKILV
jgi:hypothetical protein